MPPTWEEDEKLNKRILIEGGTFLMGPPVGPTEDPDAPEGSPHRVRLSSFYMQQHPVTNEEYGRLHPDHSPRAPNHPVVGVTWEQAMAYAGWLGGSLPTEAQWEFAARGSEGRTYPWGEEPPTPEVAMYSRDVPGAFRLFRVTAIGSYPQGATPEGIEDLAGNVFEWCRDWYGPYSEDEQEDPVGPAEGSSRVLRGGSFETFAEDLRVTSRDVNAPASSGSDIGFRVVWPASTKPG